MLVAIGALGLLAASAALVSIGDLKAAPRPAIGILLLAALAHAALGLGLFRSWPASSAPRRARLLTGIVALAVVLRILALAVPPTLSDDVYRYRWDGRVQAAGLNPYAEAPAAPQLAHLRDGHWSHINYPRIRSIYPPLAQVLFALTYRIDDSIAAFRVMASLGDLLCVALLLACLRAYGQPRWLVALYACHPLPPIEFASSGHFDAWVAAAVLAAVLAHRRGAPVLSTLMLATGVLLKAWPIVFVPLLLRERSRWHVPLLAAAVAAAYLPFLDAGPRMLQPWLDYTGRWRFNDGAFYVLAGLAGSLEAAKALAAGLGIALLGWLWMRRADAVAGGYWLLLAFILLMPTIHPWYLLWALPLAALAGDLGWTALCGLAPLAYWILVGAGGDSNVWVEPTWPRALEYVPAAIAWVVVARRYGPPAPGRIAPFARVGREPER